MSAPTKVLHVLSGCTVGGAEAHVVSLLRGLAETGSYELHLAYFVEKPDSARSLKPDFQRLGVQTHDLRAAVKWDPLGFAKLAWLMRRHRFDIVHSHSLRSVIGTAVLGGALGYPRVLVTSVHAEDPLFENTVYGGMVSVAGRRLNSVVAISEIVRRHIIRHTRIAPQKIERIYYGLDTEAANCPGRDGSISLHQEYGLPSDARLIVVVARLGTEKGHRYAIEALPGILARVPGVKLLIVGHEDSISEADLAKIAAANGVEKDVIFCGFRQDVRDVLQQADLLVLPSLREGFGLVLLEAMAARCPIVASKTGAISEVVVDGQTGILVPPGDSDALGKAVTMMLSDSTLADNLASAGKQRLEAHFTARAMVQQTHDLYQQLLDKNPRRRLA